jgi:rhodanese-related sulfurtransferase
MPQVIDRDRVRALTQSGAPLIDVLPTKEYEDAHIKGAISIPLTKLNKASAQRLSRHNPIIVYCNDYQ